jgi:hypothetical protein
MRKGGKAAKWAARSERLSAALRENLRRRKAQARGRAATPGRLEMRLRMMAMRPAHRRVKTAATGSTRELPTFAAIEATRSRHARCVVGRRQ